MTQLHKYDTTLIQLHARVRVHVQLQTVVHVGNNILYHISGNIFESTFVLQYWPTPFKPRISVN